MASFWENIYERQRVEWKKIKLIDGTNLRNDFKLITSTKLWKGIKQGTDNKLGEGIVMKKGIMLRMSIMLKKSIMLRKGIMLSGAKLSSDNALCFSFFWSASRLIPCNLILWWLFNKRWGYKDTTQPHSNGTASNVCDWFLSNNSSYCRWNNLNPYSPLEQVITVSFEGSRNEMSHEARERDGRVNEKK